MAPLRTKRLGDLQGLFAVVGLRDQEILGAHAELLRVAEIERVLGVDEMHTHHLRGERWQSRASARVVFPEDSGP